MRLLQINSKHTARQLCAVNNYGIVIFVLDEGNLVKGLRPGNGLGSTDKAFEVLGIPASLVYVKLFHQVGSIELE